MTDGDASRNAGGAAQRDGAAADAHPRDDLLDERRVRSDRRRAPDAVTALRGRLDAAADVRLDGREAVGVDVQGLDPAI